MDQKFSKFYEFDRDNLPLLEYTNIFMGNLMWIKRGVHKDIATYDLVVREMPEPWNFYVFDGLERAIDYVLNYKFTPESIEVLKSMKLIDSKEVEDFYKNLKFSGDIWALKDGTIFFPSEPIVRVTAPLAEANLLTAFMLNVFCYPIRFLSKAIRIQLAANGMNHVRLMDGAVVRLPGFEQGIYPPRSCQLIDQSIVVPYFYLKFPQYLNKTGRKTIVNINHAFVKSFDTEILAFDFVFKELLNNADEFWFMTDTYNFKNGLKNLIETIKKFPGTDPKKFFVAIDSGDILKLSFYARKELDKNGLKDIGIQVFSNLEEYKINKMVRKGAPIDVYVTGTELVNITDNPKLEAVYKMAELRKLNGEIEQKAKLTKGKESYPGRKQIYRIYENGKMVRDVIGLENETLGQPILEKYIENGVQVKKVPDLDETRDHLKKELASLPDKYKNVNKHVKYPISISQKLAEILEAVQKKHG